MDKYYFIVEGIQQGPFTIDELKDKNITDTTLVWTDNMENWIEAKAIDALKIIINKKPPPIPPQIKDNLVIEQAIKNKELTRNLIKRNLKILLYSFLFGVIFFIFHFYYTDGFANFRMYYKLKSFINTPHINPYTTIFEINDFREESIKLGWNEQDDYFVNNGDIPLTFHEHFYKKAASKSLFFSLIVIVISAAILSIGKILTKSNRQATMQFK